MTKKIKSINPYTGDPIKTYETHTTQEVSSILKTADQTFSSWSTTPINERAELMSRAGEVLLENKKEYAEMITAEMGKPITQSIAEIEKCAWVCEFYAVNAAQFLADAMIETEASESFISYDPLGCILAVMPWNYPFWQVFRFAAPSLMAGNVAVLKHASNVIGSALLITDVFKKAGFPEGCFQNLLVGHEEIEDLLEDDIIKAATLTGSEKAGVSIAATSGKNLKKTVLELGGNNACVVWKDANLDKHIETMVKARMQNTGQSCIAAKRFIVVEEIYEEFLEKFTEQVNALKIGDPQDKETDISVMAREDLAREVKKQITESIDQGAKVLLGNTQNKTYYEPTILVDVKPGMPAFDEEVFGPVAAIIKAKNETESLELAANSRFGLGTMLFTENIEKAKKSISKIEDGAFFINEMVKSDPRLPFGGTKASGYGRELSKDGIMEFVNAKTVYISK
ncbi:NAD-dependent succinate-semialdehyde dehydrogenase [Aquimarina intermedia]|uniref:Succinate-semialdehyde dehydrogenase/glutarate-semialdehyde dehydrogenase n=1 Tax=Aquimarina intermedia TaxID=350814 RepID=A0A5S5CFY3_9FLAO|nr:NAD-dependent succinate-semialdehyde dehydrogenase [Aquimarina intermedia]TYP77196.1 succinate-semialdehyde dehydrogenase/glutarate-semialdehyde dehydrogenase [Aquimarina intermedia]